MFRNVETKSFDAIVSEWDALAPMRHLQITSGIDITYRHVLVPNIRELVSSVRSATIVDAGCGVGFLSDLLADCAQAVVGIDPSAKNIAIAQECHGARVKFIRTTLEDYSKQNAASSDLVVANMVLMDVLNLQSFLSAVHRVLQPGGTLVFSVTHPWFWPTYYGYASASWFQHARETIIEGPFKISAQPDCPLLSTHVHRPLEAYIKGFRTARLSIETLLEPMPSPDIAILYPEPWTYPRYLIGSCRRSPNVSRPAEM